MNTAILIFALWMGRPTVIEYHGAIDQPFDRRLGTEISFAEAERRIVKYSPPLLFAPPSDAVIQVSKSDARQLMESWAPYEGKKVGASMRKDFQDTTRAIRQKKFAGAGS